MAADDEARIEALEQELATLREQVEALASEDERYAEIVRRMDVLAAEIERIEADRELFGDATEGVYGFGPAASKVYKVDRGVSIGGYGELLYQSFASENERHEPSGKRDQIDFLRAVVYLGYKFSDRILFNSEIEFEHASTSHGGSVAAEFAYLDFRVMENLGIRAGLLLIPMGFINELHEPPVYLGTTRPETERQIIPSTWRENGVGIFGSIGPFSYRAYGVNGFDGVYGGAAKKEKGFSAGGLRDGRQKGSKAFAEDWAFVGRLDYEGVPGFVLGGSVYAGQSGQDHELPSGEKVEAWTYIGEGHADLKWRGLELRSLVAYGRVEEADKINEWKGLADEESIGRELLGYYFQAGYDVLRSFETEHQIIPYARYEHINTQWTVPDGYSRDLANERDIISVGLAYKPIVNTVVKADYQFHDNRAITGVDQFNIALGFLF